MTARYTLDTDSFFAPYYLIKGTTIDWDGPPGPHMIPVNDEAKAKLAKYFEENPNASINPVEQLSLVQVVEAPAPSAPAPVDLTGLSGTSTPAADPSPTTLTVK